MGIWKDKVRKDWRYSFEHQKKSHAGGGYKTRRQAAAAREQHREELKAQPKPTGITFSDLSKQYLDHAERKFVKDTYNYKALVYASFIASQGDLPVTQITSKHIHKYLSTRATNNNYNMHRKDLSALFNWGRRTLKLQTHNPCLDIDKMPHQAKEKAIPTEKEILKILAAAAPGDEKDIIVCCLHTLGRIDEILRLTWQDVNFEKKAVILWTRKRRDGTYEPDALPMNQTLEETLWRRWKERKQEKWVFYNEDTGTRFIHRPKMMRSLCIRAGIKPLDPEKDLYYGFHSLRHFMASHLLDKKKASTKVVSGLLRHKNVRTTEIYLHSIDESHRQAMDEIGPFFTPEKAKPQAEAASTEEATSSK